MPWPTVAVGDNGSILIIWCSPYKDIRVVIEPDGDAFFKAVTKQLNDRGEVANTLESDGCLEGMKTMDCMMAWLMEDSAAQA